MTTKNETREPLSPAPSTPLFARRQALPAVALAATALAVSGCTESHVVTYDAGTSDAGVFDAGVTADTGVDLGSVDGDVETFDGGISPNPDAGSE